MRRWIGMSCVGLLAWACPARRPVAVLPPPAPAAPTAAAPAPPRDYTTIRDAEEQIEQVDVSALIEAQGAEDRAAEAAQPPLVGRLEARLLDEQGDPVGALSVVLLDAAGREWHTRSGANGVAHFADLPPGDYRLELQDGGIGPVDVHIDGHTEVEVRVPRSGASQPRSPVSA